jgi:RNA polymerase sigma-70 factor, ECF subfamily
MTAMTTTVKPSDQPMVDTDLVRRAQQGDVDAFAALFHANKTKIYSLCLRMTSNTAEAEDLTQEAFLLAFRKLGTFRGDSALSTWLYRVAMNTVLMHLRKRNMRTREVSLDELNDQESLKREQGKADDRLVCTVDRIALTRAIKALPAGYRTVFLLHEVEGYEHQEIARILRCSIGNTKSQLHKAKAKMRDLLRITEPQLQDIEGEPTPATPRRARVASDARSQAAKSPAWDLAEEIAA